MLAFLRALVARVFGFMRSDALDREFAEELEIHLEMAEQEKIRQGLEPHEARRQARLELGGVTQLLEAGREARGLPWIDTFWLDFKLGARMLRKSWGLSLIGGLAMTIVIAVGAAAFATFDVLLWASLPLDEGERVVAIQTWDERAHGRRETSMADFERWRESVDSVEDLGAAQTIERNIVGPDGLGEPVQIAQMTASGFDLARVRPLLGRRIRPEDERSEASPVVVLGFDAWENLFSSDPKIVGRGLRLGDVVHTVIGVMPAGFRFPVNHRLWIPLKLDRNQDLPAGPEGVVFARLSRHTSAESLEVELQSIGLTANDQGDEWLRPRVVPYTFAFTGDFEDEQLRWVVRLILMLVALLLLPPCANIAILVYARTIARQEEFAARLALGASRSRIVGQLFLEVLVLALVAAALALVLARLGLHFIESNVARELGSAPFWVDFAISPSTIVFAVLLAVLAATVAGLLPAIKATGSEMQTSLKSLGSRTGPRLGTTWTALVVAQVAFCVAVLPTALEMGWGTIRSGALGPGFAAEEYLAARLTLDEVGPATVSDGTVDSSIATDARRFSERFGQLQGQLIRQLVAEPLVRGASVAGAVPNEATWTRIEIENGSEPPSADGFVPDRLVRSLPVDMTFFDVFDQPLLAGRSFDSSDFEPGVTNVVVNQAFAERVLGGANPVGRRVRYARLAQEGDAAPGPWYQIVGVVADLYADTRRGSLYHPAALGQVHPASITLHVRADTAAAADRLRELATALDLSLRVDDIRTHDAIFRDHQRGNYVGASILGISTIAVLLLSAAGMYALMAFTVNQARREIGIRSALGARPGSLLASVFRRAFTRLGLGAALGVLVAASLARYFPVVRMGGWEIPGILPGVATLMVLLGLLATAGPARRGLAVDPIEELREG